MTTDNLPWLLCNWVTESFEKSCKFKVSWEVWQYTVKEDDTDITGTCLYAGIIDYENHYGRQSLADLAKWCYDNGYTLTTEREVI